jgi:hypothetical protein
MMHILVHRKLQECGQDQQPRQWKVGIVWIDIYALSGYCMEAWTMWYQFMGVILYLICLGSTFLAIPKSTTFT